MSKLLTVSREEILHQIKLSAKFLLLLKASLLVRFLPIQPKS
jgi:hypothetical protein